MTSDPARPANSGGGMRVASWVALLGVACALRLYALGRVSAWYDEAATWKTVSHSWDGMWQSLSQNVHPPVYYLLVRVWGRFFGLSVESLRLLSVVCGLTALLLVDRLVRECRETPAFRYPSLATWLYAISPVAIDLSQQARMYGLATCLSAVLGIGLMRVLRSPTSWTGWLWLAVSGNLLPLTHYYGLWSSATAALILLGSILSAPRIRLFGAWKQWMLALITTILAWSGWLPVFWEQHRRVQEDYWIQEFSASEISIYLAEWLSSPEVRDWGTLWWRGLCGLTVLTVIASLMTRSRRRWGIIAMAVLPVAFSVIYSLATRNLLQGRYWVMAHLYFVVTVSMFLEEISFSRLRRFLAVPFILWAVMCTALGLLHRYDTARASGLRQCSEELRKLSHPGEPVFVASSFYTPPLQWYLQGAADVYLLQPIEDLKHYQGRAIIDADEIRSLSEQALEGVDRFWCVVDERMSQTIRNPGTVAIPAGWRVVRKRQYIEANRLPTPLELWEVVRTSEVRQQKSVSRDDRD